MSIDLEQHVTLTTGFRMQWEEVQQNHVLLYPEGMVQLSETAAIILERCLEGGSIAQVIKGLEHEFGEDDLSADVLEFLTAAQAEGWVNIG